MTFQTLMSRNPKNNDLDFFETPEIATLELLRRESFDGEIYEPACGKGAIVKAIRKFNPDQEIFCSDIVDRGFEEAAIMDFLSWPGNANNIITNPPYKIAEDFIWRALDVTYNKVCMLLRLMFLESQKRYKLFTTTPLKTVYVFSYRLPFKAPDGVEWKSNGGMTPYAWFVWDKQYSGEPTIRWIQKPTE